MANTCTRKSWGTTSMNALIKIAVLAVLTIASVTQAQKRVATGTVPPATFADPNRKQKLAAALLEIEKLFNASAERMPGAVMGVIIDGELVWVKAAGIREATTKAPVTPETVFRIASMTKS